MGFFYRFRRGGAGAVRVKSGAGSMSIEEWFSLYGTKSSASVVVNQRTAMSEPTVFACVSIRSEDTARCTPRLFKLDSKGVRQQVTNHPVAKLFRKPNRLQTWFEFCEQMEAAVLLRSNAYAVILRDERGRPTELMPLDPDLVMLLEGPDASIFYQVTRSNRFMTAVLKGFPPAIPADDIFHLRGLSLGSPLVSPSRIGLASDTIGLAIALAQQACRWIANGARPAGVLQVAKTLSEAAAKRLAATWRALFGGLENTGQTAVLEEGTEWKQVQLTSVDLEFTMQRTMQVGMVARFFRVPPHKLAQTDGLRGLNLPQADQEYVNDAIMPALERWEQKFRFVFDLDDQDIEVDFDEANLLRADLTTRLNAYRIGLLSGLYATNECRNSEKLPPVPGGDEVRAPLNMAVLGSDVTGTAPDGAGRPNDGELPADSVPTS